MARAILLGALYAASCAGFQLRPAPSRHAIQSAAAFVRQSGHQRVLRARRPGDEDGDFEDENEYFDGDDERLRRPRSYRDVQNPRKWRPSLLPNELGKALLAGAFVVGVGTGVTVDSAINTNPRDLASRDAIDRQAPNPNMCQRYGMSALALDSRVFVTFNPFSVYITQSDVKPGCVLRQENVVNMLTGRKFITRDELQACKNSNNTWGWIGDINDMPQISCLWQSEDAQNEFLSDPKVGIGEDVYDDDRIRQTRQQIKLDSTELEKERRRLEKELADVGK